MSNRQIYGDGWVDEWTGGTLIETVYISSKTTGVVGGLDHCRDLSLMSNSLPAPAAWPRRDPHERCFCLQSQWKKKVRTVATPCLCSHRWLPSDTVGSGKPSENPGEEWSVASICHKSWLEGHKITIK